MKAREFLTEKQKEFIRANSKKKFISEIAVELGAASSTIYCFIKKKIILILRGLIIRKNPIVFLKKVVLIHMNAKTG